MLRPGAVKAFARKAQKAKGSGLYGIFAETDLECATLWRYLEDYAETCDLVTFNTPQQEVTFSNGARIRVFCSAWRTFIGLRFDGVLLSDESIRSLIPKQIKVPEPEPKPEEPAPTPRFGL